MTKTHSPGPWRWDKPAGYDDPSLFDANGEPIISFQLCDIGGGPDPDSPDAALIAAAPELLEACRMALMAVTTDDPCSVIPILQSAIAKAEGNVPAVE